MSRRSEQPQPRQPEERVPQTLSLPIIPGRATGSHQHPPPSTSRPQQAVPPPQPEPWQSHAEWDIPPAPTSSSRLPAVANPKGNQVKPRTNSMAATSAGGQQRALGPLLTRSRRLPPPPPRPLHRTMIWQGLLLLAMIFTLFSTMSYSNASAHGTYPNAFTAKAGGQKPEKVTDRVPTFIQLDPNIGYKSREQYNNFSGVDCSAAAAAEVLTAWGDPNASIGQVIEDMGSNNLVANGGLYSHDGFKELAERHNFDVIVSFNEFNAAQIAQIAEVQGIPVIVGVREPDWSSYYRFFAPGHFLVVVGADANGFRIIDSSTYFIHYLTTAEFLHLWDHNDTIIFTPKGYPAQIPGH